MPIDLNTQIMRIAGLQAAPVQHELVILDLDRDQYVALDAVGRHIWDIIETPRSVGALCQQLSEEFDAAPEQIVSDVLAFLKELVDNGMAQVMDG